MLICYICNTKTDIAHYSNLHNMPVCKQCWEHECDMEALKIEVDKGQRITILESQLIKAKQDLNEYKTQIAIRDEEIENQRAIIQNLSAQLNRMTTKYDDAYNAIRALHIFIHPPN